VDITEKFRRRVSEKAVAIVLERTIGIPNGSPQCVGRAATIGERNLPPTAPIPHTIVAMTPRVTR
jgi:hypothetical protein